MLSSFFKKSSPYSLIKSQLKLCRRPSLNQRALGKLIYPQITSCLAQRMLNQKCFCWQGNLNNIQNATENQNGSEKLEKAPFDKFLEEIKADAEFFKNQTFLQEQYEKLSSFESLNDKQMITLSIQQFRQKFSLILSQQRFKYSQELFETESRRKLIRQILQSLDDDTVKPIIVQGIKGIGKSHSIMLLFFILSNHKDYRSFYLNEMGILTQGNVLLKLLEITKLMVYRDMDQKLEYYNKTIAEILAEFYVAKENRQLTNDQLINFIDIYKEQMQSQGKKVVLIIDQMNQLTQNFKEKRLFALQIQSKLEDIFQFQIYGTSITDPNYPKYNPQQEEVYYLDPSLTDDEKNMICQSLFISVSAEKEQKQEILDEFEFNPYLLHQYFNFLRINPKLKQKLINVEGSLIKFKEDQKAQVEADLSKFEDENPNSKEEIKQEMGKVAAILNLKMINPYSVGIKYSKVDRRYVYQNENGWFGINTYATQIIKSKYAQINYLVIVMKLLYNNKQEGASFGNLFHTYFLQQLENIQKTQSLFEFKYSIVDLKSQNFQILKDSINPEILSLPKFDIVKSEIKKKQNDLIVDQIPQAVGQSIEKNKIILIQPSNQAPVVDFMIVIQEKIYLLQIKTGNEDMKYLKSNKSSLLSKLKDFIQLFDTKLKQNQSLTGKNFDYHFAFIILEKDSQKIDEKEFLKDFLCKNQNANEENYAIHEQAQDLQEQSLIKSFGVLDYFNLCNQMKSLEISQVIQMEEFGNK